MLLKTLPPKGWQRTSQNLVSTFWTETVPPSHSTRTEQGCFNRGEERQKPRSQRKNITDTSPIVFGVPDVENNWEGARCGVIKTGPKPSESRLALGNMRTVTVTPKRPTEFSGESSELSFVFSNGSKREVLCPLWPCSVLMLRDPFL